MDIIHFALPIASPILGAAPRRIHLQPHVEHHRGHDVEVGEVDAELPGQVEEDEQGPGQPLAEHAVGPGGGKREQAEMVGSNRFTEDRTEEYSCGLMNMVCQFCNSLNFQAERPSDGQFQSCCPKGKVILPPRRPFP
uniref:Uncharacterized protein n=1 Tax=Crocodylus porosus TaxID=8502 RepID=A0A7M4EDB4_CROPO